MAESKKKKSDEGGGGNPNVPEKAFGGAKDTGMVERLFPELGGAFEGPSFLNYNIGGYGRGAGAESDEKSKQRELLANMWREQLAAEQERKGPEAVRKNLQSYAEYQDPVRFAEQRRAASLADPFGPGGYFEGRRAADLYTPEAILASQGNTAENQWAQRGGAKGIDPEELKRLNAATYQARKTYM